MKHPYEIIKIDKYTGKIQQPNLLLMNRSFGIIGRISRYENWNITLVGNGIDEISFDVHKYNDGRLCPVWDELIDLKIVDVRGFGRFEISVDYTDNTETVKSIHGKSLETELAQIRLFDFHVNDEEAADMQITDSGSDNYDSKGNFIPTTLYREILPTDTPEIADYKRKHSLLHRVLADKAPHWSIGDVTSYIALDETSQPELSSAFQRTYTVDGDSIYDFLTGTVAEESNVIFTFDTINRKINCYNLCDCINQETGCIWEHGIGKDTSVLVSKRKLAKEISISSNKDNVKNCFRIEGGDDVITDMVRAVNMNGSNYIFQFADFQYNDMSEALRDKIRAYQTMMSSKETQDEYYGKNGIFTRLCNAYDDLAYYESSMMPDTSKATDPGTAEEQYNKVVAVLTAPDFYVAVSTVNNYRNDLFVGITNNIEAYAQVLLDSRFDLSVVDGTTSYNDSTKTWEGKIQIVQHTNERNIYPVDTSAAYPITVRINDNESEFAKQKIEKALSKGNILNIDFDVAGIWENEMLGAEEKLQKIREYFNQYSLNRLKSFYDGYNSCLSILMQMDNESDICTDMYDKYFRYMRIISNPKPNGDFPYKGVLEERQEQVENILADIEKIKKEQKTFIYGDNRRTPHDFRTYIGEELYLEFCAYRREDTYKNDNYISDGLSSSECLVKAKELIETASKEAKKACVLQRTISTSLNNLFALPEFEPLYDKFALFNYIRVRTEDEILKLRLIGVEFNGDSAEEINVTFSEQIESIDGSMDDLQSILQQASSIATSYPSTALQAKQGSEARSIVTEMYSTGLNAAKTMLTNSDNNEITITEAGIMCKRTDDEGFYGEKQLRIIGNGIYMTNDNWQSVEMALGETSFLDPITKKNTQAYGIIGHNIVGKLVASEKMYISNENGSVQITGDGIKIDKGTISWGSDVNAPEMGDIEGLNNSLSNIESNITNFKSDVGKVLGLENTTITANSIISPNIGGGYLFITGENGSVEINPKSLSYSHTSGDIFNIKNNAKDSVFRVNTSGQVHIRGGNDKSSIELDGGNGSIYTQNGSKKSVFASGYLDSTDGTYSARLSNAGLYFSKNDITYALFHSTFWGETDIRGVGVNSYADSKFISFGNKDDNSQESFLTPLVLNYGLNPDGDKQNILIYGSTLIKNKLSFGDDNCYLWHVNQNNQNNLYCGGKFGVNGFPNEKYDFTVNGNACVEENFYANANIHLNKEYDSQGLTAYGDDGEKHYVLQFDHNELITYLGMVSERDTKTIVRGKKINIRGKSVEIEDGSGVISPSDKRLKNSFKPLDEFDDVYMDIEPCAFKYNNGTSGRFHFGVTAQNVKEAFEKHGYTTQDFGGFVQMTDHEESEDHCGIDDPMGIIYTEFVMWNMHRIQELSRKINEQQTQIDSLKELISCLSKKIDDLNKTEV